MKKYSLFGYLFFISFFLVLKCSQDSNPASDDIIIECEDITCNSNVNDFIIQISVSMMNPFNSDAIDSIFDSENHFGVLENATDGYDSDYDILEPSEGAGNWISLYFPHPEWENNLGDDFTQDIKGNILDDQNEGMIEWDFDVKSNAYGIINIDFESSDDYCYDCIQSIQITLGEEVFTTEGPDIDNFNISTFLQSNQIISFNLIVEFLDSDE